MHNRKWINRICGAGLICALLASGTGAAGAPAYGKEVSETQKLAAAEGASFTEDAENQHLEHETKEVPEPEYAEGRVIVCVREGDIGEQEESAAREDGAYAGGNLSQAAMLLAGAKELMDVSDAAEELFSEGEEDSGKTKEDPQGAGEASEKTTLKLVSSDKYTTQELIDKLSSLPEVVFAEPDVIVHLEEAVEKDSRQALTEKKPAGRGIAEESEIGDSRGEKGISSETAEASLFEADKDFNGAEENVSAEAASSETENPVYGEEESVSVETASFEADEKINGEEGTVSAETASANGDDSEEKDLQDPDLTKYQYAYGSGQGGIDVPDWNEPEKKNAEGIVVAIVDTGIDYEHPDLQEVMWDEGENYPSLQALGGGKYGYCAISENTQGVPYSPNDPKDDQMRGTHCAGIVAAAWNGKGVSGAANGAKVMALKCFSDVGSAYNSDIISCFAYALEAKRCGVNIQVTSNSWSIPQEGKALKASVRELAGEGIVSVFASSNEDVNTDYELRNGSDMYRMPGVIIVDASDRLEKKADYSDYGLRSTDLFAPGSGILSTYPSDMENQLACLLAPAKDPSGSREMKNDFENEGFLALQEAGETLGASISIEEDPAEEENHALKVSARFPKGNREKNYLFLNLSTPLNTPLEPAAGMKLVFSARAEADHLYAVVDVKTETGEYEMVDACPLEKDMTPLMYSLPENTDFEDLTFELYLASEIEQDPAKEVELWLDDIYLSLDDGAASYCYASGTSMATPAVSGEAAILAAYPSFTGDSAEKRAARILGSVKPVQEFQGLCVTGGLANVRNALSEDYMPVVKEISQQETGELAISGYFFGEKETTSVTLAQEGKEYACAVKELRKDPADPDCAALLIDAPEGLKSGEALVSVKNSLQEEGRQVGI
ncbi:MAG: S8 family serine peptidase, partial [Lachnospiraceae bacterium]|nr:S8 family serine peptidase [Lachnospiraceae bacterium]